MPSQDLCQHKFQEALVARTGFDPPIHTFWRTKYRLLPIFHNWKWEIWGSHGDETCSVVDGYKRFGGPCCLHLQGSFVPCSYIVSYSYPFLLWLRAKYLSGYFCDSVSTAKIIYCRIIRRDACTRKSETGRGLPQGTILEFVWRDAVHLRSTSWTQLLMLTFHFTCSVPAVCCSAGRGKKCSGQYQHLEKGSADRSAAGYTLQRSEPTDRSI